MKKFNLIFLLVLFAGNLAFGQKMVAKEPNTDRVASKANTYQKISIPFPNLPSGEELANAIAPRLPLLEVTQTHLEVAQFSESPGSYHFTFNQIYNGVPIMDAKLKANMNKSFRVISLMNSLKSFPNTLEGSFIIKTTDIEARISREIPKGLWEVEAIEMYLADDNGLQAIIVATTFGNNDAGGALKIVYDAATGSEMFREDLASYRSPPPPDTTCKARVFMPDPITQAQTVYGNNYVDNSDQNSPYLNAWRVEVSLQDIQWDGTNFILEGPNVRIRDIDSPIIAPFSPSNCADFDVLREASAFEDINTYYHIDTFKRYVTSLGFTTLLPTPIRADPHGLNGSDNSKFVPGSNPYLSFGEGGVDDAEDADVVLHEYGHALSFGGSPGSNSGTQRQGIDEGIGDYIASSYSRSISSYNWFNVFSWDGHNTFWDGRISNDSSTYYQIDTNNIYEVGELWASTLMHAWGTLGKETMDGIFFEELYHNSNSMSIRDAANALLDSDSLRNNGANIPTLVACLCQWELLTGAVCIVGIQPPLADDNWEIFPNPASDLARIRFNPPALKQVNQLQIINLMGQTLKTISINQNEINLHLADLKNGMYLVRATGPNGVAGTKKILIER